MASETSLESCDRLRVTILGCGSSPGIPRATGDWGQCDPSNPKNKRMRSSILVERIAPLGKKTSVVIDTGPDFRQQMLMAGVKRIDSVFFTHPHADHIHGIDDLRSYALEQKEQISTYADKQTSDYLMHAFNYCFVQRPGTSWRAILSCNPIIPYSPVVIEGEGGKLSLEPLLQKHGIIHSLGFRIGNIAYCSDVSDFPEETVARLHGLELLIVDALQYNSHPGHLSFNQALEWIEQLKPLRAIFTHMHIALDYEAVIHSTPDHVQPAYDGMVFESFLET